MKDLNALVLEFKNEKDENILYNLKNEILLKEFEEIRSLSLAFKSNKLLEDDLIQEGCMVLMDALDEYNPLSLEDFSAYYKEKIKERFKELERIEDEREKAALNLTSKLNDIVLKERELKKNLKRRPTHMEISFALGIPKDELLNLMSYALSVIGGSNDSIDDNFLLSEYIDKLSITKSEDDFEIREKAADYIDILSPLEKEIIGHLFGLNGEGVKTLEEVADLYDVSSERIRQIRDLAIYKMKVEDE